MKYVLFLFLIQFQTAAVAQRFGVESSRIAFFSDGVIEDIEAVNTKVTSIFDGVKGDIAFLLKIKDFEFEKKLMQVHFNEKFLESERYPKSTFLGNVSGFDSSVKGPQRVVAKGKLSIHGVTREVSIPGTIETKGSGLVLRSKFRLRLADYNITIPQIVWQNIAEEVDVTIDFTYRAL
jgi:hypothetical protein